MSAIGPELERAMRDVGAPDSPAYQNLRAIVQGSPVLAAQMNAAAAQGHFAHFALLPENAHAAASFSPDTRTINLKAADLGDTKPQARGTLTFLLGHETQHAVNRPGTTQAMNQFGQEALATVSSGPGKPHDYTPAVQKVLVANREDEASSHIAGWNALVSNIKQGNPGATVKEVVDSRVAYVTNHFVNVDYGKSITYAVKDGIRLNDDLSITPDARNVEALGKLYFDMSPVSARLGAKGNSDYTNHYAAGLVSTACQSELTNPAHAGKLTLDMKGLKLDHALLADNGITLGNPPKPGVRCVYNDTSAPGVDRHFDHTATSRSAPVNRPSNIEQLSPVHGESARSYKSQVGLDDPVHPGHGLFKDAQFGMKFLDAKMGRASDQYTDNMAACLAVSACRKGMTRIEHVEMGTDGKNLWATQGAPGTAFGALTSASLEGAMIPVEQTSRTWDAAQKSAQQTLLEKHSQQQTQEPQQVQGHALTR